MRSLFLASGPISWASSRLRAYWPAAYLDADVHCIQETIHVDPAQYGAVVWQKAIDAGQANYLKGRGLKIYWDICDPVHWFAPHETREIIRLVDGVVCSCEALREDFAAWAYNSIPTYTIPDRLELNHYPLHRVHENVDPVRFIWYGFELNRPALFGAIANLERLYANGYPVELTIMDGSPNKQLDFHAKLPIYQIKWTLELENEVISSHDIALLPPYPGPWGKVKSNNKQLTAWACGLPVVDGFDYEEMEQMMSSNYRCATAAIQRDWLEDYRVEQSAKEWGAILCA